MRMSSACGVEIQSQQSDPSMVGSSLASSTAPPGVGPNSAPASDGGDFRHGWQRILESLHAFEDSAAKDGPQMSEATDLVPASAVSARPAAGLMDKGVRDANEAIESSPQTTRSSELSGIRQRSSLIVLPSRHLPFRPGGKQAPAKIETTDDGVKTISGMSPECALTPTTMPLVVSSSNGPSGPVQTIAEVSDAMGKPSGKQYDDQATSAINESMGAPDGRPFAGTVPGAGPDGGPSLTASASLVASRRASAEISDVDQFVNGPPAKSVATQAVRLQAGLIPPRSSSNELSASGSASTATIETQHVPFADRGALFEQGRSAGGASAATLEPENSQHARASIRETAVRPFRLNSHMVTSAMHVPAASTGTQAQGDAAAGQFATASDAEAVLFPSSSGAASALPHRAVAHEPFVSIDAGTDGTAATWVSAGGHRAEAGFQDSSLGWVSVRAQTDAGGIHAAVVPSSEVAAQVLGSHLAGLNAHMANRYENLNPITLAASDTAWSSRDAGQEMAQGDGTHTSHGGQPQQGAEDPDPVRIQPIASSSGGFTDETQSNVSMQTFNAGPSRLDGHVSFVV